MIYTKIGLVLAGGGARGAYQIGALIALRELLIDKYIKVISGTSIGALNAILFMKGNLDEAIEIWSKIDNASILPTSEHNLMFRSMLLHFGVNNISFIKKYMPKIILGGNISRVGLIDIMDKINLQFIKECDLICYAACTELEKLDTKYFRINDYNEEDIRKILLATSAIPMIYDCEEIEGGKYLDGGIVDNVPIKPVYEEGCDIIIVVHLAKVSEINRRLFPNTHIIEILPTIIEDGLFKGTLEFEKEMTKKRINTGYEDTIEIIKPLMELSRLIDSNKNRDNIKDKSLKERIKAFIKSYN
ncbi:MAG: patatin-like phospholipase family protein [Clostridium sp.]